MPTLQRKMYNAMALVNTRKSSIGDTGIFNNSGHAIKVLHTSVFFNILPCHENFHDKLGRQQDHLGASDFLLPHF